MAISDEEKELGANLRTEYAAIEAYHRSLIHYRFIIVGAYLAGASFLAKPALEGKPRAAIFACGLALLLTVCAWLLELRTRSVYRKLAIRGEQIEHDYWGYRGVNWYKGLWSSQYKSRPLVKEHNVLDHPGPDKTSLTLFGELPLWTSKHVSHSVALDLLYFGSVVAWVKLWLENLGYPLF